MFLEANVLMNVKADEYVVVFGIARDGATAEESATKMDATIAAFSEGLRALKVAESEVFVDFVAQDKIYGFDIVGDVATEKFVGLELKKNVSIRYKEHATLDRIIAAANKAEVFDLVKVDYVVKDVEAVRDKLAGEAARVLKKKAERHQKLLGITLRPPAQVFAERSSTYFPSQMYDSYVAQEAEQVIDPSFRQRHTVHGLRKGRTFFFNGLDAGEFDAVVNPSPLEPPVQFTLYLKVKYER